MKLIEMCCQVSPLDSISYNLLTYVLRQVRTPDATIFIVTPNGNIHHKDSKSTKFHKDFISILRVPVFLW